jgi:hypothetical protein
MFCVRFNPSAYRFGWPNGRFANGLLGWQPNPFSSWVTRCPIGSVLSIGKLLHGGGPCVVPVRFEYSLASVRV